MFFLRLVFFFTAVFSCFHFASHLARASSQSLPHELQVIQKLLASRFPGARVEVYAPLKWHQGKEVKSPLNISILSENGKGQALVRLSDRKNMGEAWVRFSARKKVPIAIQRVRPTERLQRAFFTFQEIDFARGNAHHFKGIVLPFDSPFEKLEARQTILAGHFPLLSHVQRVPDIRRGQMVSVKIISGGLVVSTRGVAQQRAHWGSDLTVMTEKTKRKLVGRLKKSGEVEVRL